MAEEHHAPASIRKVELHFCEGERFWKRQTVYDVRGSFRLFRVLKLFYALKVSLWAYANVVVSELMQIL